MKASKIKLFFARKRIEEEETLDDLKIRSKLVEGPADNKFDPEAGMISHVNEDDIDYQFDGEEWKPVNKKKSVIIWVAIGTVAALAVSLSVALPVALSSRRSGLPVGPVTSQSSSEPSGSATSSASQSSVSSASQSSASSVSQSSASSSTSQSSASSSASESSASSSASESSASSDSQSSASSSASESSASSASSSSSAPKTKATVTFDSKGGTAVDPVTVDLSTKLVAPADPTNGDLLFGGWYLAEQPSVAGYYDFDNVVTDDFTLYAQWVQPYVYTLNEAEEKPFYEVSDNEAYRVADVIVPGVYKGVPVKRIEYGFSSSNETIKTVAIEEGVEICDCNAFSYCPNLESVSFPNTLKQFREGAFCVYNPASLHFPSGVEKIGAYTFQNCENLTELTFDDSKTNLEFSECNFWASNLKTVKLPEGLTNLGSGTFVGSGLETIFLPSTLKETGQGLLQSVSTLKKVYSKVSKSDLEKIWDGTGPLFELNWYLYAEGGVTPANTNGYFYYYDDQGAVQEKTVSSNPITISFNVDGGVTVDPIHPAFEEPIALPTPTRDGYEFDAWYASEDASVQNYVPTGVPAINSMELVAHWVDAKLEMEYIDWREMYYVSGAEDDIVDAVVPSVYHGKEIYEIKDGAFKNHASLKSVIIEADGEARIMINEETFSGCTSLEYIVADGMITYAGKDAFKDCTSLKKVYEMLPAAYCTINDGNEAFENATRFIFTKNGAAETETGNWWYYDAGHNIVEVINA